MRMGSWLDDGLSRMDLNQVIDGKDIDIDIYRPGTTGDSPGFDDEVANLTKVGRLIARIDKYSGNTFREVVASAGKATNLLYVGRTLSDSVYINDEWRYGDFKYKVIAFDNTDVNQIGYEVLLERIV